jgi:hypothetical protein
MTDPLVPRGSGRTGTHVLTQAAECAGSSSPMYEMRRPGRDAAELTALADHLTVHGPVR